MKLFLSRVELRNINRITGIRELPVLFVSIDSVFCLNRWYVLPQEMMFFVSKAMFFLPEAMGYKKTERSQKLLSVSIYKSESKSGLR